MLVKRGNYWHGSIRVNGEPTRLKTTGCRDEKAAAAVLAEWEREAADPAYASAKRTALDQAISGLLKQYAGLVSVGKRSRSTESYWTEKLGTVARVLGPKIPLASIRAATVDALIDARRKEGAKEHSIGKELDALKLVLRYAKRAGEWSGDTQAIFPRFEKSYAPRDRTLTEDELFSLLAVLHGDDIAAQLAFSVATSAEAKCIMEAQRSDIAEDGRYVLLRGTKRELRWRTVPIVTPWQRILLDFALKHAKGEGVYLFSRTTWGLRNALRKAALSLGITHLSPNDLRRTFAVRMRESGFPLELIAPLMGHADTKMLERVYGRLTPEQLRERLVLALNVLAPVQLRVLDKPRRDASNQDRRAAAPSEEAPRAGFEPATHGLTGRGKGPVTGGFHYKAHWLDEPDGWMACNEPVH